MRDRSLLLFFAAIALARWVVPATAVAQDRVLNGVVVVRATRAPIQDARITIVGTQRSVLTDARGRFQLDGLEGAPFVLAVQRIGFRQVLDTVVADGNAIEVALTETAVPLDEIVITGVPGATGSRSVGNAVTRTPVAGLLQAAPVPNVQDVLKARVPGVMILTTQGVVGSGAAVRIRGATSLSLPNDPLLYVDGMRVDNNPRAGPYMRGGPQISRMGDISPDEIESVEIIRGPAAGTLYGTEASRGVIQILTHRGSEGPPRFGLTVRHGANWFRNPEGRVNWWFFRNPAGQLDSIHPYQREADAGRPIFQTGQPQGYNMTMGGGSPSTRYFASAGYDRDEGTLSYDWRTRISGRLNLTVRPSDKLDIETSLGLIRNRTRLAGMAISQAIGGGEVGWDVWTQLNYGLPSIVNTPFRGFFRAPPEVIATIDARSATDRAIGSIQLRHQPWKWFSQKVTAGTDIGDETSSLLFPADPRGALGWFGTLSEGDRTLDRRRMSIGSLDYVASATAQLTSQWKSTSSAGAQYYAKRIESSSAYGHGFPVGVEVIGGAAVKDASEDAIENKGGGVFVEQQFGWKNRRFLTGALRVDDNSAFGSNFNLVVYPKFSASWVVSEESFWRTGAVSALRLRGAWGVAGRQPDFFAAQRTYLPISGPGGGFGLTPLNIGNPDLKPERGQELEIGFDAGLLRDRVSLSFTGYRQVVKDAILPRILAPSGGFPGTQLVNLARVRNHGIELSVDARPLEHASLAWEVGATMSTNDSRILSLGGLGPVIPATGTLTAGQYHAEGYPVASYFYPLVTGVTINATGGVASVQCATLSGSSTVSAPCELDNVNQRLYAGRPTPSWEGSFRSAVTIFRNLRVSGLIDIRGGNASFYQMAVTAHRSQLNTRVSVTRSDTLYVAYDELGRRGVGGGIGRIGLVRGGFAKLRELSLSYTLPSSWAARIHATSVAFTVAGRNLAILWQEQKDAFGFKVLDPEVRNGFDNSGNVLNLAPPFTQLLTSLRVTF